MKIAKGCFCANLNKCTKELLAVFLCYVAAKLCILSAIICRFINNVYLCEILCAYFS